MTVTPSVSYSITVRLEVPSRGRAVSELTRAVEQAGGAVTALDVSAGRPRAAAGGRDLRGRATARTPRRSSQALSAIDGVTLQQGQRPDLPAAPRRQDRDAVKVPLRNRDDLSMAYTPGVARVSHGHRRATPRTHAG